MNALEAVSPPLSAIGVTDYCIPRSYERVKAFKEKGRLRGCELLFPNIELRLNTGTVKGNFVNVHLLVNPEDPHHLTELHRFLSRLSFVAFDDKFACTESDLRRLGARADPGKSNEEAALQHGCLQFKVSREDLLEVYRDMKWAQSNILIAVAGNADGTSGVKEASDNVLRREMEKAAHAIFAGSLKQRDFWLGYGAASLDELRRDYNGPKPCLWGSDAHSLDRVGKPDESRFCWIKGQPTFDALLQACIDPERAYVGEVPPSPAMESQVIDEVHIANAPWAITPRIPLNSGLVAIIGARGAGKTALADIIATGCGSYVPSSERPSFLARAHEYLSGATVSLNWRGQQGPTRSLLDFPIDLSADAHPRARYLSQQFVEDLCSIEGMPSLIREIERVIFEAHPALERDGAADFDELLDNRASTYHDTRVREATALAGISDQIAIEMEKTKQVSVVSAHIAEKEKLIARYQGDRVSLLPKTQSKASDRLQQVLSAAETVRGNIRYFSNQQTSLAGVNSDVRDLRQNRAPAALRSMQEQHQRAGITPEDWKRFLLDYTGDVSSVVDQKSKEVSQNLASWKGSSPRRPVQDDGAFVTDNARLDHLSLAVLDAEAERLGRLVAADKVTADRLAAILKRLADENVSLQKLKEKLADCTGAKQRAEELVSLRDKGYTRVFDAILDEESVLTELYAPLTKRLAAAGGTLAKLSFTVSRVVNVRGWATRGESLFDKRGGPFKGIGTLEREANTLLAQAWHRGNSADVSGAMSAFIERHVPSLLEDAPYPKSDTSNYRAWSKRFAQWLYSTDHISIEYGIKYDGIDIHKLSPGTRGIVLVLLYLALDDGDDRPLIIDQPEENLDPKSIYDELVPLFQSAKSRRQVILVTHNANLVVNTDADQIIVAKVGAHPGNGLPPITYYAGGLEEESMRRIVCDILEGGDRAFRDRARRLRIGLNR
ncbi:ATP-binding protein [Bradyrhizobium sp. WSM471]|nr:MULTISPECIES: AAA family ATPase [Bradyrhizobium]UFW40513.1 ATP-binding protein [Bradyrhizobium canariense]